MTKIDRQIGTIISDYLEQKYQVNILASTIQVQKTKKEIEGDYTINVFPFLRQIKTSPDVLANEIGSFLSEKLSVVEKYYVLKGFLNIVLKNQFWSNSLKTSDIEQVSDKETIMIEYSSPNTNKPLHLGHVRNNLLGFSIAQILKAVGKDVKMVNLVNDRGIHICKSMLAWQKWGNGINPEIANKKGDKLVGDFYVLFDKEYKKQIEILISEGLDKETATNQAPLINEARELLIKWEAGDDDTIKLWKKMNSWVYDGFEKTYKKLGVIFDKIYYESQTYHHGKDVVLNALNKNILEKQEDGSVWADLTSFNLDKKVLLRSDGTSVYITQDIGTAIQRFEEFKPNLMIYVVGNEQNYHFQALKSILNLMNYSFHDKISHLSYGMVELPEGKMKSREGTVVDADDLVDEMIKTASEISDELGKLDSLTVEDKEKTIEKISLGALKYFILKVDPKKNMMFNPKESIDFNGNTGPFIQYSYSRISSILRNAKENNINISDSAFEVNTINDKERDLIKAIYDFSDIVNESAKYLNPALIANYLYELSKTFNQFYHDCSILKENDTLQRELRLQICKQCGEVIKNGMSLLGIEVPERM